jgi:hypothetical protein
MIVLYSPCQLKHFVKQCFLFLPQLFFQTQMSYNNNNHQGIIQGVPMYGPGGAFPPPSFYPPPGDNGDKQYHNNNNNNNLSPQSGSTAAWGGPQQLPPQQNNGYPAQGWESHQYHQPQPVTMIIVQSPMNQGPFGMPLPPGAPRLNPAEEEACTAVLHELSILKIYIFIATFFLFLNALFAAYWWAMAVVIFGPIAIYALRTFEKNWLIGGAFLFPLIIICRIVTIIGIWTWDKHNPGLQNDFERYANSGIAVIIGLCDAYFFFKYWWRVASPTIDMTEEQREWMRLFRTLTCGCL